MSVDYTVKNAIMYKTPSGDEGFSQKCPFCGHISDSTFALFGESHDAELEILCRSCNEKFKVSFAPKPSKSVNVSTQSSPDPVSPNLENKGRVISKNKCEIDDLGVLHSLLFLVPDAQGVPVQGIIKESDNRFRQQTP